MDKDSTKAESPDKARGKRTRVFKVDVDRIAEELEEAGVTGLHKSTLAAMFEDLDQTVESVRGKRSNVVMVRVSQDSLDRLDDLVECGLTRSRSEAAAFLITEGVKARSDLFDKIADQTRVIRNAKERLRELLKDEELPRKHGDATVIIADADQVK
ncbi:MAG: hypothetical protein OXJ90_04280 [Spirochaetaceae bacterium]|nr:hypothetical protein [Spirochaetaceae bacterium]